MTEAHQNHTDGQHSHGGSEEKESITLGGAVAMAVYSPYCPERGALFMAVFYCLPILAMAGLGWLLGPRLLRW